MTFNIGAGAVSKLLCQMSNFQNMSQYGSMSQFGSKNLNNYAFIFMLGNQGGKCSGHQQADTGSKANGHNHHHKNERNESNNSSRCDHNSRGNDSDRGSSNSRGGQCSQGSKDTERNYWRPGQSSSYDCNKGDKGHNNGGWQPSRNDGHDKCGSKQTQQQSSHDCHKGDKGHNSGGSQGSHGSSNGKCDNQKDAKWTATDVKDGKATIKLGDKYTIDLDENTSTWTLKDKDGNCTRVWGDPHVDVGNNGINDFDFKKNATFQLEDGTKITVGTTPYGGTGQTLSSTLTITNGKNAMQVSGLGMNYDGANNLKIEQSKDGRTLDRKTPDGAFTAKQDGSNWKIDGQYANQTVVNQKEAKA